MKIKPKTQGKTKNPKINWIKVKTDYLAQNLSPDASEPYTFAKCAEKWGIGHKHLMAKAKEEDWKAQLDQQATQIAQDTLEKIHHDSVETEGGIRIRQAEIARIAQEKARAALKLIDPAKLQPRDIIKLAALGLGEERKALGFPDRVEFEDITQGHSDDYESPLEKAQKAKAMNALGDRLLKAMNSGEKDSE